MLLRAKPSLEDLTYGENRDIIDNSMSRTPAAGKQDGRATIKPVSEAQSLIALPLSSAKPISARSKPRAL